MIDKFPENTTSLSGNIANSFRVLLFWLIVLRNASSRNVRKSVKKSWIQTQKPMISKMYSALSETGAYKYVKYELWAVEHEETNNATNRQTELTNVLLEIFISWF